MSGPCERANLELAERYEVEAANLPPDASPFLKVTLLQLAAGARNTARWAAMFEDQDDESTT